MNERIGTKITVKAKEITQKVLNSEPAAVVGGLLTVHRDAPLNLIASQAIADGLFISLALNEAPSNPNTALVTIVSMSANRLIHTAFVYAHKRKKNIE